MSLLEIIILSIIQGITEFLPVSSTGHLIFLSDILDINTSDIYFDITVHLGSLLSMKVSQMLVLKTFWQKKDNLNLPIQNILHQ